MRQQVLNDAKSLPNRGRSQSATTCDSSYAPTSAQYYSLLQSTTKYYFVLQSPTPVLLCTTSTTPRPPTSPNTAPATQNDRPKSDRNFLKTAETSFIQCAADPRRIREWSDHEPVSPQPVAQPRLLFALAMSILYWKIQRFALRLSFQISPNTAPATKSDLLLDDSDSYYLTIPITWLCDVVRISEVSQPKLPWTSLDYINLR